MFSVSKCRLDCSDQIIPIEMTQLLLIVPVKLFNK